MAHQRAESQLETLANLIQQRNAVDRDIARIIGRPAQTGHIGEWLAQAIFDVRLKHSATQAGFDGRFQAGPLAGKTVNVKWYPKREGLLDINEQHLPDFFLVLTGPKADAVTSRGTTRPLTFTKVFLFEAATLVSHLRARGVKIGVATSVRKERWNAARIYPMASADPPLDVTSEQARCLALFGPRNQ